MDKNVGGNDRLARWVVGGGLLAYGLTQRGWRRWLALTLGGNVLGTAAAQRCLINGLIGVNTCPSGMNKKKVDERIDEAAEESFPASDPPAFTAGVA